MSILMQTPFYRETWFIIVIVLLVLSIAGVLIYFRARRFIIRQNVLRMLVDRKTKEIREQNRELEKNNIIKTRLISIISHDLVTPLRFLHIAGKNLLENTDNMNEELRNEALAEMVNTSRELEMLSTNILNWIKYQNENRRLVKEHFNLHEQIEQIFKVLRALARQKNITLNNDTDTSFTMFQYVEPIKIILYNLVVNAINFMERGNITIAARQLRNGLLIEVKDEGFGMTREQIDNILSDQFVVSGVNTEGRKGNGLGYLIVKDLLRVINGGFTIKSVKNKGTTIKLFFPLEGDQMGKSALTSTFFN